LPQKNFGFVYYAEAIHALESNSVMTAPVYAARNDVNIYWEYALKELGQSRAIGKFDL
jgi:hypothetical protein